MSNDKKVIIVAVVIVLVLVGGIWYATHQAVVYPPVTASSTSSQASSTATSSSKPSTTATPHYSTVSPARPVAPPPSYGSIPIAPYITSFSPAAGTPGTVVTINGVYFSRTINYVTFGSTAGRHRSDGTPDNQIEAIASSDGTTLTFTVPTSGPSGLLCDNQNTCAAIAATAIQPGSYPVTVRDSVGTSNTVTFTVIQ